MEQKKPFDLITQTGAGLQHFYQEDEVTLVDLWRIIARHKWLVLSIILLCLALGWLVGVFTKPVYESRAVVSIGQVNGVGQLEGPKALVQRLREEYRVRDSTEGAIVPPFVSDVAFSKAGGDNIIVIKARGDTAAQANQFLNGVTAKLLREHQRLYDGVRRKLQDRLDSLLRQQNNIHQEFTVIDDRIRALGNTDPSLGATLTLEKSSLMEQLPTLEENISSLQLKLSSVQSSPTTLMRNPTVPIGAVKPRPVLYIVLAGMFGIVLGIFAAFAAQFVKKARAQAQAEEEAAGNRV